MKYQKCLTIMGLIAIAGVLAYAAAQFILDGAAYTKVSKLSSPNQKHTIHEFHSMDEGGRHAPYGQMLTLTHETHAKKPEDGHIFFAGYCKLPLRYEWIGNETVSIHCLDGNREGGPRTLSTVVYGIKVVYAEQ